MNLSALEEFMYGEQLDQMQEKIDRFYKDKMGVFGRSSTPALIKKIHVTRMSQLEIFEKCCEHVEEIMTEYKLLE